MTSKKFFLTTLIAVSLSLAFTACKKDEVQPAFLYKSQGFVKGKITGSSADGLYTFNDDFIYTQYNVAFNSASIYTITSGGAYEITIARLDYNNSGSAKIVFGLSNAGDTTPDAADIKINYTKEQNDKIIVFNISSSVTNTTTITDFTFESATGRVKGKYSVSGTDNSTGKNASVTGDFDVIIKRDIQ